MTPTNAELIFWAVALILAVITVAILYFINRRMEEKDIERMFAHCTYTEYHDDLEDYE